MEETLEINIIENDKKENIKNSKLFKYIVLITIISLIISIIIILFLLILLLKEKSNKKFEILIRNEQINKSFSYNLSSEVIQLKNGLKAILIFEPNSTSSSISVLSNYGSSVDVIQGLAHFSEHMAFRGSKNFRDNIFWTGFNHISTSNDAFTIFENTCFYFSSKIENLYEKFIDIISDLLQNPLLNLSVIKNEINIVNSEYLKSNRTDDYILNNILSELVNDDHPIHNQLSIGNNITLNSKSNEEMVKYLRAYFQQAFNPKNLNIVLYSNKSISYMENLVLKYFNYKININENIGNEEREEKRKKIKERKLFNKDKGGKILKYYSKFSSNLNDPSIYNLLTISFGINNIIYKDGFNPIDFLQFLISKSKNTYLNKHLIKKKYIYFLLPKIYKQFLETEFGFFHIYIFITETGINNLEEVIKVVFHYLNLIKNNLEEIEKNIFPNYQKYKLNLFKYSYNENKNLNDINREIILNMKKHGLENIFKNDVPEKFDKDLFYKFLEENINIENAIISLNSNYDISKINIFTNYSINYLNNYGNQYNLTNLKSEFIEILKKYPVDENYKNIKIRNKNNYLTNISSPNKPCYLINNKECENKEEYNPLIEKSYKKYKCNNDTNYTNNTNNIHFCYYINDRSLNIPRVKIILKIKSDNEILSPINKVFFNSYYLKPVLSSYFDGFIEDPNNEFSISLGEELIITIQTYKDIVTSFLDEFIDKLLNIIDEDEFNKEINYLKFTIYKEIGNSYLNLDNYNKGFILEIFNSGNSFNYPSIGYNYINQLDYYINYTFISNIFKSFKNSLIEYSKLYIIGDLDNNLISNLSSIVKNKIKLNSKINKNIKNSLENNLSVNIKSEKYLNENKIINKFSEIMPKKNIIENTVVNYIYSNNNTYEKESYTGIFYNIKMLNPNYNNYFDIFYHIIKEKIIRELRSKKGLGYYAYSNLVVTASQERYFYIYLEGPMKTPIEIQDEIHSVLNEILNNWNCENFEEIKNSYLNYIKLSYNENTFSKRVNEFISDVKNKNFNFTDFQNLLPNNCNEMINGVRNIFENPIRIGIFEYAHYFNSTYINQEIENRKDELYFLNKNITVKYTKDINYFK